MDKAFAATPAPPYYAVIFSARRTEGDHGYEAMAKAMVELALEAAGLPRRRIDARS